MSVEPGQPASSNEAHAAEHFEEGEEAAPRFVHAMAIVRWFLVLTMASIAALSMLYVYGDTGHAEEHAATQYYCPMHPGVVQDHPGSCPICGMTLVAREVEHTHSESSDAGTASKPSVRAPAAQKRAKPSLEDAGTLSEVVPGLTAVDIPEQRLQRIGMRTAKVRRMALPEELKAVGYVAATESGLAVIQTRFSGWIEELLVAQTGELVQRGQLLARVYSPDLLAAQQELINAQKWASGAGAKDGAGFRGSARSRLELMGMERREIEEVERTGTPHRLIEIRSPVRGYVAQKSALQGLYIQPGTRLFDIADLSKVWVMVELFERDAARIAIQQRASLTLTAYPGETFSGKVQLVYPTLSVETRTQRARVEFKNPDLRLRPGMFGDVVIRLGSAEGLVVPREAIVDTGEQQYVFVSEAAGRFAPRVVKLGARSQELVQILAGLAEGETVVTTGNFLIDSESRLRFAVDGKAQKHTH
jgi:multidrug efflux pump subunit AcrA (membrane-fusion protein)